MKHLIDPLDLSTEEIDHLLDTAADIEANPSKYAHLCEGKNSPPCFMSRAPAPA